MQKQLNTYPQLVNLVLVVVRAPGCQFVEPRIETAARPELAGLARSNRWGYEPQKDALTLAVILGLEH